MFKRRERRYNRSSNASPEEKTERVRTRRPSRHTLPLNRKHGGFSRFETQQIDELQEVFNLIDQDRDGEISRTDLKDCLISLGQQPTETEIRDMLKEIEAPSDLAHFLEMFGNKMDSVDSDELIRNAFSCFDEKGDGLIDFEEVRELLMTMGKRLTKKQVDDIFLQHNIIDENGKFRCEDVIKLFKYGSGD